MQERWIAHYKILGRLGSGGMGEVLLAEDTQLGRKVALKMLPLDLADDAERQARLRREAQAVAALNHPNIVTVYSVDEVDGQWFLTMEFVEGDTLDELMRQPLPLARFHEIAVPLTDAIAAAHARGVIHRDLKPVNIMVTKEERIKVLDFGLAKIKTESDEVQVIDADTEVATPTGAIIGTTAYMSPEQLRGLPADERSDIFSLGVTLFAIATGHHPFAGRTEAERITAILRDRPQLASEVRRDVPPDVTQVINACLQKDPAHRPSAKEVHEALARKRPIETHAPLQSVAVLPFADLSPQRDQDYLCAGIADELMNALTKIAGLKVASRTSCMQFKGAAADIRDIGHRIGVDTVVEGSVRKAENRLRISAQLTKVEDGYQLWAERYDRELEDVFTIQEEIALCIVSALEITLNPRARRALQRTQTIDAQAYEFYLRGRQFQQRLDRRSLDFGRDMFKQAIQIDPNYAMAYCGIADCSAYLYFYHGPNDERKQAVEDASRRALELDPQLPEAHASRGQAFLVADDYAAADAEFELAIRLDPRLFEGYAFYGCSSFAQGRIEHAGELFKKASELRPDDYQTRSLQALIHKSQGDHERAVAAHRQALERIKAHLSLNPDDVRARYLGAVALIEVGECEEGLTWARRALAMDPDDALVRYNVACAFTTAGAHEEAIDCLEQAASTMRASAYVDWIANDPDLRPLQGNPRYEALMKRMRENP